ncbi:MAG TPA: zf-HC2 domain-containing protein [Bryobacteraceae bacterium]|nr:zf-HC2 domain-containing protein [Bryobacteraceae bacterium]HUO32257.1 zf-HC2 domain-containing protein [Bryobacteraceae bacterium]
MSCSGVDLKAYVLGEGSQREKAVVEDHVRVCESCRDELERLRLTQTALAALEAEEIPQRIAFVSDGVFEPRWWRTMWRSGPAMGFASAALLAGAIVVHGFTLRPAASGQPGVDTAQIEQRVETEVSARISAAVTKAVSEAQARQAAEFSKVVDDMKRQRESDLETFQQAADYYQKLMARFEVASNEGSGR